MPNFGCEAIIWDTRQHLCFRKRDIVLVQCQQANWRFELYTRTDRAPPSPPAPPFLPPVPPHAPMPPELPLHRMNHATCEALWKDPNSRFHDLWAAEGWRVRNGDGDTACWGRDGPKYFDDAWWGRSCDRNWYTGTPGSQLGDVNRNGPIDPRVEPHFTDGLAPALLGFDETIDAYCAARGSGDQHSEVCVRANVNILSLYGDRIPYNTCRNIEWQICAAKGMLPGQGGEWKEGLEGRIREKASIRFAYAPKDLRPLDGDRPLGHCGGFMPMGCGRRGYASSDIYYMEVCVLDTFCSNRESLWELDVGEDWHCDLEWEGYVQFRDWVLSRGRTTHQKHRNS